MVISCSNAEEPTQLSFSVGGLSYHIDNKDYSRSHHNLVGINYVHASAGTFINSYNRRAVYAGYTTEQIELGNGFSAKLTAGAVAGYRSCYGDNGKKTKLCPILVPTLSYNASSFAKPSLMILGTAVVAAVEIPISL